MFRNEEMVTINDIQISRNGFKNLTFETSKFSDRFDSIRGFGSMPNVRNLNTVDIFSIDFVIDYEELREFAAIYSMFKAYGVLPLKNTYILNKIKGTLAYERAIEKLSEKERKQLEVNKYVNVMLEKMSIKSLERTNNGYEVSMVLSLYKRGFSETEFKRFRDLYNNWNANTKFEEICYKNIEKEIDRLGTDGSIRLEFMSIERINANIKNGALMQEKTEYFSDADKYEKEIESQLRREQIQEYADLNKAKVITIPAANIGQIEFITHNNISNMPIFGEPIGLKSFIGAGYSTFVVKLVFDEDDAEILSELKTLSDKDITKAVMSIDTPLTKMFDFHSASINKMFFNNIEEANGVMVTILFDINSYNYISENSNGNLSTVFKGSSTDYKNLYTVGMYLEGLSQHIYESKQANRSAILNMFSQVLETKTEDKREGKANIATKNDLRIKKYYFGDFLSSYSSIILSFGYHMSIRTFEKENSLITGNSIREGIKEIKEGLSTENKEVKLTARVPESFSVYNDRYNKKHKVNGEYMTLASEYINDLLNGYNTSFASVPGSAEVSTKDIVSNMLFYRVFDCIGALNSFSSNELKELIVDVFNRNFDEKDGFEGSFIEFTDKFIDKTTNELLNDKSTLGNNLENMMKRFFYKNLLINIFDLNKSISSMDTEEADFIKGGNINFVKIKEKIGYVYDSAAKAFFTSIQNDKLFEKSVSYVINRMNRNPELFEGMSKEYSAIESTLEPEWERFKSNFKIEMDANSETNKEIAYLIFLTKLNYGLSILNTDKIVKEYMSVEDFNKYINSLVYSSGYIGFFLIKTEGRTDKLGFAVRAGCNNIGDKLSSFMYMMKLNEGVTDDIMINNYYGSKLKFSYFKQKDISFNPIVDPYENESDINKDFNYFYGEKINSYFPETFIEKSFDNTDRIVSKNIVEDFLTKAMVSFAKQEQYCEAISYTYKKILHYYAKVPYYFKSLFLKAKENKLIINEVMQKRVLGNGDPFKNFKDITEIVTDMNQDIIPDYDIIIGNETKTGFGSLYNYVNLRNYIELNNIASIKISKDPNKKIKSAIIRIIDFNKQLVNLDTKGQSISFKVSADETGKGKLEMFTITPGDQVKINMGYSDDKKNVFCGFIDSIFSNGGVTEITCLNYASSLYSNIIKELDLGDDSFISTVLNYISVSVKNAGTQSTIVKKENVEKITNIFKQNSHLFQSFGYDHGKALVEGELASMYNAFNLCLAYLNKEIKNKLSSSSSSNGMLVISKDTIDAVFNATGNLDEYDDPRSTESNMDFYKNIFNVDCDYETYGIQYVEEYTDIEAGTDGKDVSYVHEKDYSGYTTTSEQGVVTDNEQVAESAVVSEEAKGMFAWPCDSRRITSRFSTRRKHPTIENLYRGHPAIDIGSIKDGKNPNYIYATAAGKIITARYKGQNGNFIEIDHGNQIVSQYLHMKELRVFEGESVLQGDVIGIMGDTGRTKSGAKVSDGIHLDFRIKIKGQNKDPEQLLKGGDIS